MKFNFFKKNKEENKTEEKNVSKSEKTEIRTNLINILGSCHFLGFLFFFRK